MACCDGTYKVAKTQEWGMKCNAWNTSFGMEWNLGDQVIKVTVMDKGRVTVSHFLNLLGVASTEQKN